MSPSWPSLRLSVTHRRRGPDESSSLSRRSSSRVTVVRCHLPPRGAAIPRSFNSAAMALMETKPALRSLRIVGASLSARMSAARLFPNPLLIPPPLGSPRRLSILTTVLRCHLPPAAPGIPLRFNSFASPRWETKPAAISFWMVGSKARARASALCLFAKAPLRDAFSSPTCSMEPSWPSLDVRR